MNNPTRTADDRIMKRKTDRMFRRRGADGRERGPWYAWGFDANGHRWQESTRQLDYRAARIVAREIERRRVEAVSVERAIVMLLETGAR